MTKNTETNEATTCCGGAAQKPAGETGCCQQQGGSKGGLVFVLVLLAIVAVGGLGYLSSKIADKNLAEEAAGLPVVEEDIVEIDEAPAPDVVTEIQPGNPVVATIGKDEIKRDDVIAYIKNLPVQVQQLPLDKIFPAALEQIINEKLVRINAAKVNLDSDAEVKEKLAAAKKEIVATVFLKKEIAARVTPENLDKTYKAYIASLDDVEEVKAAHILVEDEALAQELIQKLEKGADFAALAKEYSKDLVSAKNGGDIGYFAANEVVPEFAQAAFAQEVGKHSFTPVKSQFGYHIIKVEDRRKRPIPTLEEVKPILEGQIRQAALKDLFEQWRSTATIELFDINGKPVEEGKPAAPDAAKAP